MKNISTHIFKHTLKDIHKHTENRKFCFVIGAGASRKSGIPTGGELAKEWFTQIEERLTKSDLRKWTQEQTINDTDLAASYGAIYRKRFENDKTSGYEVLVQAMKHAKPSFGHIVLAQILSRSSGHCILTTNFDSLIESSVYQFTDKTPLVCGHESLSGYARPSATHPLIIKIHRDLLLSPKSDPDEINSLDKGWQEPLDHIFSTHIPIIIGYGGNDGSLMSYFEQMNKPSNFFWCGTDENRISDRIKTLIENHDGSFVNIAGFDQLMYELLWVFDEIRPIDKELSEITGERVKTAKEQFEEITSLSSTQFAGEVKETNQKTQKKELSALEYDNLAEKEPNLEKRKNIYLEALRKYPNTGWLWSNFVYFLQFEKHDFEELDNYYKKAIELNDKNSGILGNYAVYLKEIKKDYDSAEEVYIKALKLDPDNAFILGSYANFLRHIKKDAKNAERLYKKTISIIPNDSTFIGNYAQFLLSRGELIEGNTYREKALELNAEQENEVLIELWFCNYAHFPEFLELSETKIEALLNKGVRSIGWSFNDNIAEAIKNNHPNPEKLKDFAERITTE